MRKPKSDIRRHWNAAADKTPVIRRLVDFLIRRSLLQKAEPLLTEAVNNPKG